MQNIIKQHDLFAIVESWLDPKDRIPRVDGYINFRSDRKKQSRAKKGIWWVNCVLQKYISRGHNKVCKQTKWRDVDKTRSNLFGLEKDLYICMT